MSASVFPARAGMSPLYVLSLVAPLCVPRASGDEPSLIARAVVFWRCSPRERG